ncbi:MAG: tetratricopeptide repeat protein [Persicimonas sp.]
MKHILSIALVLVVVTIGHSKQLRAEDEPEDAAYSKVLEEANAAYNEGKYDAAEEGYVLAVQARPEEAVPYRNLARTYFWQSDYAPAVAYYDMYMQQASGAEDIEQVRAERKLASSRAGGEPWAVPESQQMALSALEEQLDSGSAYTRGGGGAWGLYQTLLRTGFAQPELARLRRQVVSRLLGEFEGRLVTDTDQPTPRLDLEDWQIQKERLDAAKSVSSDPAVNEALARRSLIPETATALLNGRYEQAVTLAKEAGEENPDMPFIRWFEVSALVEADQAERALEAVDALAKSLEDSAPQHLGYVRIVRASVLERLGRHDEAADIYLGVIVD